MEASRAPANAAVVRSPTAVYHLTSRENTLAARELRFDESRWTSSTLTCPTCAEVILGDGHGFKRFERFAGARVVDVAKDHMGMHVRVEVPPHHVVDLGWAEDCPQPADYSKNLKPVRACVFGTQLAWVGGMLATPDNDRVPGLRR